VYVQVGEHGWIAIIRLSVANRAMIMFTRNERAQKRCGKSMARTATS